MFPLETDVAVVGGGALGSATALELCRRGRRVVLFERFGLGNSRGSSHGATRIFRVSYPDPRYSALALESLDDWARLERDGSETLLDFTGGIDLGEGALTCAASLESLGVRCEELDRQQVEDLAGIQVPEDMPAVFQPQTGVIAAAKTVQVQLELARRAGCDVRAETMVMSVEAADSGGVEIITDRGRVTSEVAVICAGPWARPVAASAGFDLPVLPTIEQVTYLRPQRESIPVIIDWTHPLHYLVPMSFGAPGWKVGTHHAGEPVDPNEGPFDPLPDRDFAAAEWVARLTGSSPEIVAAETCLYTNAPSDEFILDRARDVVVVSACSGHGFKFAPRMGRAAADLAQGIDPALPGDIGSM